MSNPRGYLLVKHWAEFQHYKRRSPPWIKLHRSLLSDYDFTRLRDVDKAHLLLIWIEASNHNGAVPNDASWLRRRLGLHSDPNLKLLINQGWLTPDASAMQAIRLHDANPESEDISEREGKPVDKSAQNATFKPKPFDKEQDEKNTEMNRLIATALAEGNSSLARAIRDRPLYCIRHPGTIAFAWSKDWRIAHCRDCGPV